MSVLRQNMQFWMGGGGAEKCILDVLQKTFFVVMHDFLPTYM